MDYRNILPESKVFIELIDHPATFGMVVEIMGAYIQLSMAEVLDLCTPRQRRLLGDLGTKWRPGAYFYGPKDQIEIIAGKM